MRSWIITSCLLLSPAVLAQVAPFANADEVTVFAGSSTGASVPVAADVWAGVTRAVGAGADAASVTVAHEVRTEELELHWQLAARSTNAGNSVAIANLRYEFYSVEQAGDLVIEWTPSIAGISAASLSVDVGMDGVVDATGSAVLPVTLGANPLRLRITASASAQSGLVSGPWGSSWDWDGAATAELRVRFVPRNVTADVVALATCTPAPTLTANPDLQLGVVLRCELPTGSHGALAVLGFAPLAVALPWSAQCTLFVDPVATVWLPADANGRVRLSLAIPAAMRPNGFRAQLAAVNLASFAWTAGDGLLVSAF